STVPVVPATSPATKGSWSSTFSRLRASRARATPWRWVTSPCPFWSPWSCSTTRTPG
ncbi:hypothetical protein BgiMline_036830, partial [Biomphalaria glabrata]